MSLRSHGVSSRSRSGVGPRPKTGGRGPADGRASSSKQPSAEPKARRIPHDGNLDSSLALIRDPYRYLSATCDRLRTDVFQMRMMLRKTICLRGAEGAELFYDESRVRRSGAAPRRVLLTLFGRGGVQGLDGDAHRHRKQMFLSLMTPERIAVLVELAEQCWQDGAAEWEQAEFVVLYDEVRRILCRSVCEWAGVPLPVEEIDRRTSQLAAMYEQAGSFGRKHRRARRERKRAEKDLARMVEQIRQGALSPARETAAHVIAWHRDLSGNLLSPRIAAVELLNVLRPVVAVSVFITLAAHALTQVPRCRRNLQDGPSESSEYREWFVQEVRRFYPFFPAVVGETAAEFTWKGYRFHQGTRLILDLYGTNHDSRIWPDPDTFRPERFHARQPGPFELIPQGGGEHSQHHRCPGEWITIALMKQAVDFLSRSISYDVPSQDLRLNMSQLPALPRSRFVIENVRRLH